MISDEHDGTSVLANLVSVVINIIYIVPEIQSCQVTLAFVISVLILKIHP